MPVPVSLYSLVYISRARNKWAKGSHGLQYRFIIVQTQNISYNYNLIYPQIIHKAQSLRLPVIISRTAGAVFMYQRI